MSTGGAKAHPLLGAKLSTVWANSLFEARLRPDGPAYLADHQVQGAAVTPAAAYVEQGLAAADALFGAGRHILENIVIQQAMFLPAGVQRRVQVSVAPESGGESRFETYSQIVDDEKKSGAWSMHATGSLVHESSRGSEGEVEQVDLESVRGKSVATTSRDDFYALMAARGLVYGPAFQVLDDLHRGTREAVARVAMPDSVVREASRYHLHPALGDALLQSMAGAVPLEEDGTFSPFTYMPVGIRRVRIVEPIDDYRVPLFTYAVRTSDEAGPSPERVEGNVYLVSESGRILAALEGVVVQRLGRSGASAKEESNAREWLYRVRWKASETSSAAVAPDGKPGVAAGAWLIFGDKHGVGRELAARFTERGQRSVVVEAGDGLAIDPHTSGNGRPGQLTLATVDPLEGDHYRRLITSTFLEQKQACQGVVHLWSLDVPENSDRAIEIARRLGCGSVLHLVRALLDGQLAKAPPLWLVTGGAQAVGDEAVTVHQSPLLGMGRVIAMELPDLRSHLVDLDPTDIRRQPRAAAESLLVELLASDPEGEVACRDGRRYVARLTREPSLLEEPTSDASTSLAVPSGSAFQLRITQAGSFDALRLVPVDRQRPTAGQVEIEVRAAGLNFSDVLKALGLYPGIRDAIVPLGIEASGVVTAVGPGVDRFRAGDEVFGVVPYAFASHAVTAEYALVAKPASVDHDEACTIPITFLTAYYGLVRLAQLQPGERVLIHAGAGGVGLAAIQIAQQIGAEIYATAGSQEKRELLRSLGVKHVYSSRNVDFADEILADTDRQGVDVVLNSLPGEAITKSLSILRAYGRFLEIGKTDIYQNRMIGLLPFQDNLSYFAIDLDRMLRQRPEFIRALFAEVMEHFALGRYRPLAFTRFAARQTIDAFRYMSQRKNIGKVVVDMARQAAGGKHGEERRNHHLDPPESEAAPLVRRDGTYLITGGLGALGLRVADWLVEQGAGAIALLSRRGYSPQVEADLAAIRDRGTRVTVLGGDVANPQSLRAALAQLPSDWPPLRGVFHAAGVLDDGVMTEMTLERLDRAMSPKVAGGWNLHVATLDAPLDFFVLFSSVASVLGSPGQANYAAGNAFLDALSHFRHAQGRPAIAINWGPWAETGMAADAGRGESVKSRGMELLPPATGLELLGKLLRSDQAQVAVMHAHWPDMLRLLGSRRPALLHDIAAEAEQAGGEAADRHVDWEFRNQLLAADAAQRQSLVADYIRGELARIIGVEPHTLESEQPLNTYGLDSLLALELKNNLEGRLDFTLPMAKLMEGPSIATLAAETARLVVASADDGAVSSAADGTDADAQAWTPLLALRSSGSRPPLVLLPALGGDIQCYAELVHQLGDDQPVYAFRPRGVDEDLPPHLTMAEMMADYAGALRALVPTGPYYLAGWSTGGIYAYALADALERAGESVGLIALFDTPLPSICDAVDVEDEVRFLCSLLNFANVFAGTNMRLEYDNLRTLPPEERFQKALAEARQQGTIPAEAPESFIRRLIRVGEANVRVIQGYQPRGLAAPVHLFVPHTKGGLAEVSGAVMPEEEDHGWSAVVGRTFHIHQMPGDHFTMMLGENASQLASDLATLLKRTAQQKDIAVRLAAAGGQPSAR
jgi:NADPH:quinone reductase-like Zn-dependent oxidoreductase/thioesterase domain-containing protein/nucleoside-diphosphate-sugar epimerase